EAHPAGADRGPEPRFVTEDRDLDAGRGCGLDDSGALRHLDAAFVDRDGDELGGAHAGTSAAWWCACWSTGANKPSSDDSPPNGQPPWSMWARNSSRNLTTYDATGIAAASPSGHRHLPRIRSQTSSSRSSCECVAFPASIALSSCTIHRVPSRQGVHLPQDSCM